MRIGQLTDCYRPVINGVTNAVCSLKAQLERVGHQAPVFTTGHLGFGDEQQDIIRSWGLSLGSTGYCAALGYSRQAQTRIAAMDLLHVHHPFLAGSIALRYGRRFGKPVVYTNHTRLDLYTKAYVPRPLASPVWQALRWYFLRFTSGCDLVIAPSAGLALIMRERWGVKAPLVIVPNGIELDRFQQPKAAATREELGLPPDGTLAIYTGRLSPEKNLDFLLRAFAVVAAQEDRAHLVLLGEGSQAEALRRIVQELGLGERVTFLGAIAYEGVPTFLALSDLFVTASVTEVHPLSLIEGLASGLPAVGISSPGVADTIEDGVNGLLTAHHPAAFASALGRLMRDAQLRSRLADGARRSGACYGIERTTARTLDLYQRVLDEHTGGNGSDPRSA